MTYHKYDDAKKLKFSHNALCSTLSIHLFRHLRKISHKSSPLSTSQMQKKLKNSKKLQGKNELLMSLGILDYKRRRLSATKAVSRVGTLR